MSSGVPSIHVLPVEQQFTGMNLPTWKLQLKALLIGKGLWGYIEGTIPRPSPPPANQPVIYPPHTPVYSKTPSLEEWDFRDGLARSTIILNVTDPRGLGVDDSSTAKQAWDSIELEHGKRTEMALSEARRVLDMTKYKEGTKMEDHVKDMRTKKANVNDLSETPIDDKTYCGILIRSIPLSHTWIPMVPSLYSCASSTDIVALLHTHANHLYGNKFKDSADNSMALSATSSHDSSTPCKNPKCKAINKSSHGWPDCYWEGGGKEGQFPSNFGRNRRNPRANATSTAPQANAASSHVQHFVLAARTLNRDPMSAQGVEVEIIDESPPVFQGEWNGTRTFWGWDGDSESEFSADSDVESMPGLMSLDDDDESDTEDDDSDDEFESMPGLVPVDDDDGSDLEDDDPDADETESSASSEFEFIDADNDSESASLAGFELVDRLIEEAAQEYICDIPVSDHAFVTTTFPDKNPTITHNFMDSGASDHFMKDKADFIEYRASEYRTGTSAVQGAGSFPIVGMGTVVKHFRVGGKLIKVTFKNALHAPSLAANLISISALDSAGLFTTFGENRAVVRKKNGAEMFSGRGANGMYVLDAEANPTTSPSRPSAMSSRSSPSNICQWHRRFVHASPETITRMAKSNLVDGLDVTDFTIDGKCEACILARQTRRPFDVPTDPDVEPLELVAVDLWGPSRTQSQGGKVYLMPIVDSGTSFKHAAFLGDKSDDTTLAAFDEYRVMAENQTGKKIKALRVDGAFAGSKWKDYCKEHGIKLQLTAPHSSAQNGLAERSIRTTIEDTRALLRDAGLPHQFWAEAAAMSVYTRNLIPSKRHPDVIPAEAFTRKRQDVSHLRVFGSVCWAKIPTVNGLQVNGGSKLDDRSVKCTFLGYASGGNYKLLDRTSGRVFISRDVVFEEGLPRRTSSSAGEIEGDIELFAPDNVDVDNDPSSTSSTPSTTTTINSTPTTPVQAPQPEPRRSTRTIIPTTAIENSREYLQSEQAARTRGDEWAAQAETVRPRAAMAQLSVELDDYIICMAATKSSNPIPRSYNDAMRLDSVRWKKAMDTEYDVLMKKHTWDLVDKPPGVNVMDCMWVYDVKWNGEGVAIRDKARLVGKGYTQQLGLDYNETWAAVTRLESVRMSAAIAAHLGLHLWQVDFVSAYLNSETKEDIYMRQPPGYVVPGGEEKVCKLVHTIYGTMQGAHDWYETLSATYSDLGYYTSRADPCVRTKWSEDGSFTMTDTYTDDVWGASSSEEEAKRRMKELGDEWEIKDVGENKYFLGMRIDQDMNAGTIRLSQRPYFENVVERFNLEHVTLRSTPLPLGIILDNTMSPTNDAERREMDDKPYRRVLGSVMWAQIATRPDLAFAVSLLARFQSNPGPAHWQALMHTIGYIKSTLDYGITYSKDHPLKPFGFVDADYGGCRDTKRSTSGYVFLMAGGPVCWSAKRQATVALSTVEAEYVSLTRAAQQLKWIYSWMEEVGLAQERPGILKGDNRGAVSLTSNTRNHGKVKHIDIREHYIRELVQAGEIEVEFIRGNVNPADIFTKPLPRDAHYRYLSDLNILPA